MSQPRGHRGRGTPNGGQNRGRGRGVYRGSGRGRGRGRGRGGHLDDSSQFANVSHQLFGGSAQHDGVSVFDFNDMQAFQAINTGPKPQNGKHYRGRGNNQKRGQPSRGNITPGSGKRSRPYDADDFIPQSAPVPNTGTQTKKPRTSGLGFSDIKAAVIQTEFRDLKWESTRPLLKPVKFVRAKERLFEANPEELLEAHELPPHEADALDPQAERLADAIEEVNEPVFEASAVELSDSSDDADGTGDVTITTKVDNEKTIIHSGNQVIETTSTLVEHSIKQDEPFYFDSTPQTTQAVNSIAYDIGRVTLGEELGEDYEIILVPDRTVGKPLRTESPPLTASTAPVIHLIPPTADAKSLVFGDLKVSEKATSISQSFSIPPSSKRSISTPLRARTEAKRARKIARDKLKRSKQPLFTQEDSLGAGETPRVGDSDLEWGSDGPPGGIPEVDNSDEELNGGMDVDPDFDHQAYAKLLGKVHDAHVTIEEADDDEDESEDEVDPELDIDLSGPFLAYEFSSSDTDSDDDEDEDEDEDDMTPDAAWQQKLAQMRQRQGSVAPKDDLEEYETAADKAERTLAMLEELLMDPDPMEMSRKERKKFFKTVIELDADFSMSQGKKKKLPLLLQAQWERDRQKKALRKQQRELDRANGLLKQKKNKKKRIDLDGVERIMRRMTKNEGIKTMELPPLDKPTRVKVHAMALAFNLQSKSDNSKGGKHSDTKIMRLSRTSRTGRPINERKVASLLGNGGGYNGSSGKHKLQEGEIVGHKAEKISQENMGFKLLAKMGWAEGDRIGVQGGIEAPITAVMKKTKLGLGAAF